MSEPKKSIGGLWIKETRNGKKMLSGSIEGVGRVVIWKNDRKQPGEKYPDYRVFVDDWVPNQPRQSNTPETQGPAQPAMADDDIPF